MTDVFISAALEDAGRAQELVGAITAAGLSCHTDAGGISDGVTLEALESCRVLVFVLSTAANQSAHVIRSLERASGRGVPIITFAIEAANPSPSISFFTATTAPIRGWDALDAARPIATLVDACRGAVKGSGRLRQHRGLRGKFSRAEYTDSRRLLALVTIAVAICGLICVYALVKDVRYLIAFLTMGVPADPALVSSLNPSILGPAATLWAVLIASIVVLRRARLNLAAQFVRHVETSGSEIIWRPLVPIGNAFWLPRMAIDLWRAAAPDPSAQGASWRLLSYWRAVLLAGYVVALLRDMPYTPPQYTLRFAAGSIAFELISLAMAGVSVSIWRTLDARVRERCVASRQPVAAPPATPPIATDADVLLLYEAEDEAIARIMASRLDTYGCRSWTCASIAPDDAFAAFHVVFVLVSAASHASERLVTLVSAATKVRATVVPVVVDEPPVGSPLGHYVRSLHWLQAASVLGSGYGSALAGVFSSARRSPVAAPTPIDDRLFTRVSGTDAGRRNYRASWLLRGVAKAAAVLQIVVACGVIPIAAIIAIFPEGAEDPSGNISILLVGLSLPAWLLFVVWLSRAHVNAEALFTPGIGSRRRLILRTALPPISLVTAGAAIGRLYAAIVGRSDAAHARRASTSRLWTVAGVVMTACALVGWYVGDLGFVPVAMLFSIAQSGAVAVRGVLRRRIISEVSEHFDKRARLFSATSSALPPPKAAAVSAYQ